MKFPKVFWASLVVVLVILADQILKIWIKTNFMLYENIKIADWFYLYFIENNGMGYGIELMDKTFLSIFRIIASTGLLYYLYLLIRRDYPLPYIVCISLIFAGAVGNIIDSIFYGVVFDSSYGQLASFMPAGGGYSTWLQGKVVDMFYFPLIRTSWPSWVPSWGGDEFIFFSPIFNVADAAISVGIAVLLLFYRNTLSKGMEITSIES
ncbi:lipoprotein signal peptidase [Bacteroidales bacterium]|nr:lipoprotein signal peptidase [Bacteroidales bacterium]